MHWCAIRFVSDEVTPVVFNRELPYLNKVNDTKHLLGAQRKREWQTDMLIVELFFVPSFGCLQVLAKRYAQKDMDGFCLYLWVPSPSRFLLRRFPSCLLLWLLASVHGKLWSCVERARNDNKGNRGAGTFSARLSVELERMARPGSSAKPRLEHNRWLGLALTHHEVFIYLLTYIHTYIHIYIYTYTHTALTCQTHKHMLPSIWYKLNCFNHFMSDYQFIYLNRDFFYAHVCLEFQQSNSCLQIYDALSQVFPRSDYILAQKAIANYHLRGNIYIYVYIKNKNKMID